VIGGVLLAGILYLLGSSSGLSSLGLGSSGSQSVCSFFPGFPCNSNATVPGLGGLGTGGIDLNGLANILLAVGVVTGALIIFGGYLFQSQEPNRRKAGGILAAVMLILGSLPTLGGLLIGFILTAIGCYMGLTYKAARSNLTIGLGPVGSVTLGPQTSAPTGSGAGPLNYCIKCGSRVRDGAVFCGACGARVPE